MIGRTFFSMTLLVGIFFAAFKLEAGGIGFVSNMNALFIILGGMLSAALFTDTWRKILWAIRLLKKSFGSREDIDRTIQTIVDLARNYRKKWSIRLLEQQANHLPPGFLKTGMELLTFHNSRDKIERALHREAINIYAQYETAYKILRNMVRLAPVLGLSGAFVHLIRFFGNTSSSPDLLGSIAFAILSTFYGLILARLFFAPLANKLKEFMEQERLRMEIIQDGILCLYDQEHPRAILNKLEIRSAAMALSNQLRISPRIVLLPPGERPVENKIL
jgi:chemotaxis protein MotA